MVDGQRMVDGVANLAAIGAAVPDRPERSVVGVVVVEIGELGRMVVEVGPLFFFPSTEYWKLFPLALQRPFFSNRLKRIMYAAHNE